MMNALLEVLGCLGLSTVGAAAQDHLPAAPAVPAVQSDALERAAFTVPSPRQLAWQQLEFTAFVHFGMNTFSDREWGDGTEDPASFHPTDFDADQWVSAMQAAGMRMLILTAKHHDGFCLWPSAFTNHTVASSAWKDGQGDVLREVSDACRRAGMALGIYLSPWDRHEASYGDSPRYNDYFVNQLTEVLTGYGEISDVWFDGACGEGPNGKRQVYDWARYWAVIRKLQPGATISVMGPDVRWCGNEAGASRASEWSVMPLPASEADSDEAWVSAITGFNAQAEAPGSAAALRESHASGGSLAWWPAQVNTSIRPGWFYHEDEDGRVKSLTQLLDIYYGSVGGNAQFLLNLPPDRRGRIHENDVERLRDLGRVLRATFDEDLAFGASTGAPETLDSRTDTFWKAPDGARSAVLEYDLGEPRTFNVALLAEPLTEGQRIAAFTLERNTEAGWKEFASATTVGHKRLCRFDEVTASRVRIRIEDARAAPRLARFGLFRSPSILRAPKISRSLDGIVRVGGGEGVTITYTLDGTAPTPESTPYVRPFSLARGGVVRALATPLGNTLIPGVQGDQSAAGVESRRDFGLAKEGWRIASVSSEETGAEDGRAANAIDDDPDTIWHTEWRAANPPHPHSLRIDLGEDILLGGITYMPRQGAPDGGVVESFEVYVAKDGSDAGELAAKGRFDNVLNGRETRRVSFAEPVLGRFLRFVSLSSPGGKPWAGAAEIGVLPYVIEGVLPAAEVQHSFFVAGPSFTGIVDASGQTQWSAGRAGARDGWILENGNVLVAWADEALEFRFGTQEIVWRYALSETAKELGTVQRLGNGRTLVTELGPSPRLLEVDAYGEIVLAVPLVPGTDNAHMQTRMARKEDDGTYLVPHLLAHAVKRYSAEGEVLGTFPTDLESLGGRAAENWPFTAIRLPSGGLLVGCTHGNKVVEFDAQGGVAWILNNEDVGGIIRDACGVQRLPNGNTVVASYAARGGIKLFEVNRAKEIVWSYDGPHRVHHFQILTTNGQPIPGRPMR